MSGSKKDIVINRTIFERRKSSIYICTRAKKKVIQFKQKEIHKQQKIR